MPPSLNNLKGKVFGKLVVKDFLGRDRNHKPIWICNCDCGKEVNVLGPNLTKGASRSCGCARADTLKKRNTKHGHSIRNNTHPLYATWKNMISRCQYPNNNQYKDYGGRGIKVCDQWHDFSCFLSDMGMKPKGKTIDRIDNDGNYEPSNCRWASRVEQANNCRKNRMISCFGKNQSLSMWSSEYQIPAGTIAARIDDCRWSEEKAIATPVRKMRKGR